MNINDKGFRVLEEMGWCCHVVILVNTMEMMMTGKLFGFIGGIFGIALVLLFRTIDIWDLKNE